MNPVKFGQGQICTLANLGISKLTTVNLLTPVDFRMRWNPE